MLYKDYIRSLFIGKKVRFTSDCIVKIDISGTVVGIDHAGSELVFLVNTGDRIVKIGENTSKLTVEFL
jgi:hypothetical protein